MVELYIETLPVYEAGEYIGTVSIVIDEQTKKKRALLRREVI